MSSININFNIDGWNSSLAALALMGFQEPVKELGNILRDCLHEGRVRLNEILEKCRNIRNQKAIAEENTRPINAKFIVSWI